MNCVKNDICSDIVGLNGMPIEVVGTCVLSVEMSKNMCVKQKFVVIDGRKCCSNHEFLLGTDFTTGFSSVSFKYDEGIVLLEKDAKVCQLSLGSAQASVNLKPIHFIALRPNEECVLPTHLTRHSQREVRRSAGHTPTSVITLPNSQLTETLGVEVDTCVAQTSGPIPLRVRNISPTTVVLKPWHVIATAVDAHDLHVEEPAQPIHLTQQSADQDKSEPIAAASSRTPTCTPATTVAAQQVSDADLSTLDQDKQEQLRNVLQRYSHVFTDSLTGIGSTSPKIPPMSIDTGDAAPTRLPFYRHSPEKEAEIQRQITELLSAGLVEPSFSEWAAPVILVKKPHGKWRLCCDFRALNKVTKPIHFPMPTLRAILDKIGEAKPKYFTVLDMTAGYHQIPLDAETKEKTTFVTSSGAWNYRFVPFGLKGAPGHFQGVMATRVLRGLMYRCCVPYLDDVIIYSSTWEEHLRNIEQVLKRFEDFGLKLNIKKCEFAKTSGVKYLGHILSAEGVAPDPKKIALMKDFPVPTTPKELKGFLGLASYYRSFCLRFSDLAAPLFLLLKKDTTFTWGQSQQRAFDAIKHVLTTAPLLGLPDWTSPFYLYTDASDYALGFILGQKRDNGKEMVIEFSGRTLNESERRLPTVHKEFLAIANGVQHFRPYLEGRKFTVVTDNIAMTALRHISGTKGRFARLGWMLSDFDFDIVHRAGRKHNNADALSRMDFSRVPTDHQAPVYVFDAIHAATDGFDASSQARNDANSEQTRSVGEQTTPDSEQTRLNGEQTTLDSEQTRPVGEKTLSREKTTECEDQSSRLQQIPWTSNEMRQEQWDDLETGPILRYLENNEVPDVEPTAKFLRFEAQQCFIDNGMLYRSVLPGKRRPDVSSMTPTEDELLSPVYSVVYVPRKYRSTLLHAYHDSFFLAHQGVTKTYHLLRTRFYWRSMYKDVQQFIQTCVVCQSAKRNYTHKNAPHLSRGMPTHTFDRVSMDILKAGEEDALGYKYILTMVDDLSKWVEAYPLKTEKAADVAEAMWSNWICRYGCMRTLHTDRGTNFTSKLMKALCELMGVKKTFTSSYRPCANGQAERANQEILKHLRILKAQQKNVPWSKHLPPAMFTANITRSESSKYPAYVVQFGHQAPLPLDNPDFDATPAAASPDEYLSILQSQLDYIRKEAIINIEKSQSSHLKYANRRASLPTYEKGDVVWLSVVRPAPKTSHKLAPKFDTLCYIVDVHPGYTYTLRRYHDNIPLSTKIHADRLRPFRNPENRKLAEELEEDATDKLQAPTPDDQSLPGTHSQIPDTPDGPTQDKGSSTDGFEDKEIDRIVSSRITRDGRLFLVKLKGKDTDEWFKQTSIPRVLQRKYFLGKARKARKKQANRYKY